MPTTQAIVRETVKVVEIRTKIRDAVKGAMMEKMYQDFPNPLGSILESFARQESSLQEYLDRKKKADNDLAQNRFTAAKKLNEKTENVYSLKKLETALKEYRSIDKELKAAHKKDVKKIEADYRGKKESEAKKSPEPSSDNTGSGKKRSFRGLLPRIRRNKDR